MSYWGDSNGPNGICARCSRRFPLRDLMPDPNSPGLRVCEDDIDNYDPWREAPIQVEDITLQYPRPDTPLNIPAVEPNTPAWPID